MSSNLMIGEPAPHEQQPGQHEDVVMERGPLVFRGGAFEQARSDLSFNAADLARGGLLASALNEGQSPTTEITDRCWVTDPGTGQMMRVEQAVQFGMLRRDGRGGYVETGIDLAGRPVARDGEQQQARQQRTGLSPEAAQSYARLQQLGAGAVNSAVETAIAKGIGAVDTVELGRVTGRDAGEVSQTVKAAARGLQEQADAAVREMGFDPTHFYAWAQANQPDELRAAMRRHYHSADPSAYVELVDAYQRRVPPDADTLRAAGFHVFTNDGTHGFARGEEMVDLGNGKVTSIAAAAAAGLI